MLPVFTLLKAYSLVTGQIKTPIISISMGEAEINYLFLFIFEAVRLFT